MESPSATYPPEPVTRPSCARRRWPRPGRGRRSPRGTPAGRPRPPRRGRHRPTRWAAASSAWLPWYCERGPNARGPTVDTALQHGVVRAPGPRYLHDALFFSSTDELVAAAVPFVRDGLAGGDAVVVAASPATSDVVLAAVDGHERVRVVERDAAYARRTPATVTMFRRLADELSAAGARRVRVVGETDFGRTGREWLEGQPYEAGINDAPGPSPLWGMCVLDPTQLPQPAAEAGPRA